MVVLQRIAEGEEPMMDFRVSLFAFEYLNMRALQVCTFLHAWRYVLARRTSHMNLKIARC